ncbi:LysR substrate-binding domain-containing protein [Desulfuribacillus alkaliarsenatis]|uniref:HTH lysR-type domain-containing protein n=1 Tax=Desulfuribacillus alkaliarsenatis TaxID=766136 RepID=A0A1E5G3M7_9FIRM|nr:LysR substrate-binding domain-containing protein [Desulfuribacillus alkaliarsenatis]OEF97675.1 hypothetical protein BHF68_14330 [Desulfuribacillus alkaliarsenatis]
MNKHQLEVFLTVAQTKQISSAAKLLHLSQPAVSSQIKAIENHYGASMFERTKQGVELTAPGKIAMKHALKILASYDEMDREIDQYLNIDNQKLIVGTTQTVGNYAIPCSIWTFKQKYPNAKIILEVDSLKSILQQLADGQIDIAVVEGMDYLKLYENRFIEKMTSSDEAIIIYPGQDAWTEQFETIDSLSELSKHPFIMPKKGLGLVEPFLDTLEKNDLSIDSFNIASELGSIGSIKSSVLAGLGYSISSRMAVQKELKHGTIRELAIPDFAAPMPFKLVYRNDSFLSLISKRFIQFITVPQELQYCE